MRKATWPLVIGFLSASMTGYSSTLKLSDAPLSQVVELYSRETGRNLFLDESVQAQRKVTAHLQGLPISDAFGLVLKTLGLESAEVASGTWVVYPPERAARYRQGARSWVWQLPKGLDAKWVTGLLSGVLPGLKVSTAPGDAGRLLFIGLDEQVTEAKRLAERLPGMAVQQCFLPMSEAEARFLQTEFRLEGVESEATAAGLSGRGQPESLIRWEKEARERQKRAGWFGEMFAFEHLDAGKGLKAAEPVKGRAVIADLGGTGSLWIEGPKRDRERVIAVLRGLDEREKRERKEIILGEVKPEAVREAVKTAGLSVEALGDKRVVLIGKGRSVNEAAEILQVMGKKRRQVLVQFRLAEISRGKLKTLGIDLDKSAYGYGEIKEFHPKDTLPLLLRVMHEGKDAKILAEPNLRVIEGEEARVTIGDRIPLEVAATAQTESGSTLKLNAQLTWVDVGIKMTVKNVAVNPDGSIRMGLRGEVSSVVSLTKQGYPQIRTREAESALRVENGGAIVMGGLLSREERETQTKIPLIGNIPILGQLARGRDRQKTDTEIVMVVTAKTMEE